MNFDSNNSGWQPLQFHDSSCEPQFTITNSYETGLDDFFTRSDSSKSPALKRRPSIAGIAVRALGSITDRVFIQTRVKTVFSCFPHTDAQSTKIKGIGKLYDTLLELSRPGVYQADLRNTARRLVVGQIQSGQTLELVRALGRWNVIELEVFLFGLVETALLSRSKKTTPRPSSSGQVSEPTLEQTALLMARVTQTGPSAYHAVLDAKFMDIVLSIKEDAFLPQEMADVYRALLLIATRPEFQHRPVGMTALNLLARSIASANDTFVNMYICWAPKEMRSLMEGVLRALAPTWYARFSATTADPDMVPKFLKIEKMKEVPPFEMRFLYTFLVFSRRISTRNSQGCWIMIRSGFLDVLLSLREIIPTVGQCHDSLDMLLHVLREQNARKYSDQEKSLALELLFFHDTLREMTTDLCGKLSSWKPNEYKRMLELLLIKLRHIVREGARGAIWKHDQDRFILSVMYFLSRLALYSGDIPCQVVVSAGYLDILRFLQAHGFEIRPVIEELNVALQVLRPSNAALAVTERHRSNALRLILHEICSGNGLYLYPQLEHWTTEDLCGFSKLLVSELNNALKDRPETLMLGWEYKTYFCAFVDQISALDPSVSQAVVDAGYLGVVLSVHQESKDVKSAFSDFCYQESESDSKPFSFSTCVSDCPSFVNTGRSIKSKRSKSDLYNKAKLDFLRYIRVIT